jgi:hypothetical protein
MLAETLKNIYFDSAPVALEGGSEVVVKIREEKPLPLRRERLYRIVLLYLLGGREVNVHAAADCAIERVRSTARGDDVRIEADWLVLGHGAGIYLLDAIATSENRRYRGMVNDFAVIDLDDYGVCVAPGKIENKVLSERMAFLRVNFRPELRREFETELLRLLDVELTLLDDMKLLRRAKRIRADG